jgi:hypothetical protein
MISEKKHIQLCDEFILCLDESRFYDAHEAIEEIWFPRRFEDNNEVKLLKGFINASVSFELVKKGKKEAGKRVWKNYLKYIELLELLNSKYISKYKEIASKIESVKLSQ